MKPYILGILVLVTVFSSFLVLDHNSKTEKVAAAKVVFKSTDGGQTWQDISQGLPENLQKDGVRGDSIFANDQGLFLRVGNEVFHSAPAASSASSSFWTKEPSSGKNITTAQGKSWTFAYDSWSVNMRTKNGSSIWSPMFANTDGPHISSSFESAGGTVFIGLADGLIRSNDGGITWKHVYSGSLIGHLAESDGVLLATSMRKIIRSTDNGETWAEATSEDAVAWDIKPIKGGFVAITSELETGKRRLSTSYDGGKTWQSTHSRLQDKAVIDSIERTWNDRPLLETFEASITKVGEDLLCNHRLGIFRSSDKGKTWKPLLSSMDGKVFSLFGSGKVMYAVRSKGGC